MAGRFIRKVYHRDGEDGGTLPIAGTVKIDDSPDVPVRRQVRLFHKESGRLVRETWSAEVTGAYEFPRMKHQAYFAIAHDHTAIYNAVVKDAIVPEVPT